MEKKKTQIQKKVVRLFLLFNIYTTPKYEVTKYSHEYFDFSAFTDLVKCARFIK